MSARTTSEVGNITVRKLPKILVGVATFAVLSLGAVPDASGLTLKEFDRLSSIQKENFITTVLHFNYYTYQSSPETESKARCMKDLSRRELSTGEPYLSALAIKNIQMRHAEPTHGRTVEKIIKDLIDQECHSH